MEPFGEAVYKADSLENTALLYNLEQFLYFEFEILSKLFDL